ncbi:hypothetical protein F5148DRAFT_1006949 [Russula earlei]|uniref:Uncharacterized protein n=1 Tax=Russula earlei TaxID=71964 RepID=A0ACC0UNY9_9AGAM|nr:hypothetical protein F5148DRAFT_1006949 [Russula earlei]
MDTKPPLSPRNRFHRKRLSVTRLSTDTTATLPAYPPTENAPDDRPPDYPESANEADADTDRSTSDDTLHPLTSPRPRRLHPHRRRHIPSPIILPPTPTDPYLDSLLARSVHALEMSNALLQSSITTHSSLSAVLAADSPVVESSLEARARILSLRIGGSAGAHANWLDDLTVISEHIATDSRPDALGLNLGHDDPISRSLPVGPSPLRLRARRHHRNHSSADLRQINSEADHPDEPHLCLSNWPRSRLIAPAPRAITQYVESNADPETILLPSTLGLRSSSSAHLPFGSRSPPPLSPPSSSQSTSAEPLTVASTLLSSFLMRRPSTSSTTLHPSPSSHSKHRPRASTDPAACSSHTSSPTSSSRTHSQFSNPIRSRGSKRPVTPPLTLPVLVLPTRPLTPPTEDPSLSSLSSTSSSNPSSSDPHPNPVLSVQALRKILDDQPTASSMSRVPSDASRRPAFLPRTPLPAPTLGTSTATASVSRLFSKPVHMHSGSSSREPRPSALKGGSRTPQSPADSASSVRSTPKRISFADLPEPYGSERGGGSGRGFEKRGARRGKKRSGRSKGKGKSSADGEDESDEDDGKAWWARLLMGSAHARASSLGRPEDRIEARIARGLGSRGGFGGGMEDWAV